MSANEVTRQWVQQYVSNRRAWWRDQGVRGWVSGEQVYLVRYSRPGYPIASTSVDVFWEDRAGAAALIEGEVLTMLRKRAEKRVLGEEAARAVDPEWTAKYPGLWEHITATRYPDGTARECGSLLIFVQDGQLKGMLRDKDQGLCLWASAAGCSQLFELFEVMLASDDAEWREDRQAPGQKAKRSPRRP